MRKTSAGVHCSGALSHGAPAARTTAAAKKNRQTTRRINMVGPTLILIGLDALTPQTVVESEIVCVLAITACRKMLASQPGAKPTKLGSTFRFFHFGFPFRRPTPRPFVLF